MKIIYHVGVHCTDEGHLLRCLLENRDVLREQNILVPDPARYRALLRENVIDIKGAVVPVDVQKAVYEKIVGPQEGDRLILGWENFLAYWQWSFRRRLYPASAERVRSLSHLFSDAQCEFHFALRNLATFLPGLHQKYAAKKPWDDFMRGVDPLDWRWSDMINDIVMQTPGVSLTVWCDEDSPLIWPEILEAVSGCTPGTLFKGTYAYLADLMTVEGGALLKAKMDTSPPKTVEERKDMVSHFMELYPRSEKTEVAVNVPGWSLDTVAMLTALYEDDIEEIKKIPNVRFLSA